MPASLQTLTNAIAADPGLRSAISLAQLNLGLTASQSLNSVLLNMITLSGVNTDGLISAQDMQVISDAIWQPVNAQPWRDFWLAHGNDAGTNSTGFHLVKGDGGTLMFRGRSFVDTVADGIYHFGFQVTASRYLNEDGTPNAALSDVAGWLNYFLNGQSVVWGSDAAERLGSGTYSDAFAAARNETFYAGLGDDSIWADIGNDVVHGGAGNDVSAGGAGNDRLWGEDGNDTLWGDDGNDSVYGGVGDDDLSGNAGDDVLNGMAGNDVLNGGMGRDVVVGGDGDDALRGNEDADWFSGAAGNDSISGGDGNDQIFGGDGADTISGGNGTDRINAGTGADLITLWESVAAADTLVFAPGDSGRTRATIDRVEGFHSGQDHISLTAFGPMTFEDLDFIGGGHASCYYDGQYLRIDGNGDRATDMIVQFAWVGSLVAGDFIFA